MYEHHLGPCPCDLRTGLVGAEDQAGDGEPFGCWELPSLTDDQALSGHGVGWSAGDDFVFVVGAHRAQPGDGLAARHRHWRHARRRGLPQRRVDQRPVLEQDQAVLGRHLEHARDPQYPARVVAAENRPEEAGFFADVLEPAEGVDRERDDVAWPGIDLRVLAVLAEREAPAAAVNHEDLGRIVAVL